jgi:hypothetical protein
MSAFTDLLARIDKLTDQQARAALGMLARTAPEQLADVLGRLEED